MEIANEQVVLRELNNTIESWIDRTFNFIKLEVLEKISDNNLYDYILQPDKRKFLLEYLDDSDEVIIILDYCQQNDIDNEDERISKYVKFDGTIKESFIACIDDSWEDFCEFALEEYQSDIEDFIQEQGNENYPMWNTCFEWRDSYRNEDETNEKVISVGCGIIEGLDPFNNLIFMTSEEHSFYSSYWISLYFSLFPNEEEKYKGIDYSSL